MKREQHEEIKSDPKFDGLEPRLRAERYLKVNGREIEEFECNGEHYVYVDGFLVQMTYEQAFRKAARL